MTLKLSKTYQFEDSITRLLSNRFVQNELKSSWLVREFIPSDPPERDEVEVDLADMLHAFIASARTVIQMNESNIADDTQIRARRFLFDNGYYVKSFT